MGTSGCTEKCPHPIYLYLARIKIDWNLYIYFMIQWREIDSHFWMLRPTRIITTNWFYDFCRIWGPVKVLIIHVKVKYRTTAAFAYYCICFLFCSERPLHRKKCTTRSCRLWDDWWEATDTIWCFITAWGICCKLIHSWGWKGEAQQVGGGIQVKPWTNHACEKKYR